MYKIVRSQKVLMNKTSWRREYDCAIRWHCNGARQLRRVCRVAATKSNKLQQQKATRHCATVCSEPTRNQSKASLHAATHLVGCRQRFLQAIPRKLAGYFLLQHQKQALIGSEFGFVNCRPINARYDTFNALHGFHNKEFQKCQKNRRSRVYPTHPAIHSQTIEYGYTNKHLFVLGIWFRLAIFSFILKFPISFARVTNKIQSRNKNTFLGKNHSEKKPRR